MTVDYIGNICSFTYNIAFTNVDIQGYRKGLYVQLFILFFVYFLSQVLHTFRYKSNLVQVPGQPNRTSELPRQSVKQDQMLEKQRNDIRPQLPWNERRWNRGFPVIFSNHAAAIGMCLLFSPLPGALIWAYIHLIVFILFVAAELMIKRLLASLLKILMEFINLALILIGVIGINYAQIQSNGLCAASLLTNNNPALLL